MSNEMSHRSYGDGVGVACGAPTIRCVTRNVKALSNAKMYTAMSTEITTTMSVRRTIVSRLGQVTFCSSDQHSWANSMIPTRPPRGIAGVLVDISEPRLHCERDSNSQPLVL